MELRNYHHIFCDGDWSPGLSEHLIALKESGLAGELGILYVGLVGARDNRERVKSYIAGQIPYKVVAEKLVGWEQETLDILWQDCKSSPEPFKALYTHSKGSAFPSRMNTPWRQDMTEYVVGHWKEAVELLETYDATGIFYIKGLVFFAGNFYWANSSYIAKLEAPGREDRHQAESWFRQSPPNFYNMKPGAAPSYRLPIINLTNGKEKENNPMAILVTFKCNGRVLKYLPNTIYVEELNPGLEVLLKRDADLCLIDPPSYERLLQEKDALLHPAPAPVEEKVTDGSVSNSESYSSSANTTEHKSARGQDNGNGTGKKSTERNPSSESTSASS